MEGVISPVTALNITKRHKPGNMMDIYDTDTEKADVVSHLLVAGETKTMTVANNMADLETGCLGETALHFSKIALIG